MYHNICFLKYDESKNMLSSSISLPPHLEWLALNVFQIPLSIISYVHKLQDQKVDQLPLCSSLPLKEPFHPSEPIINWWKMSISHMTNTTIVRRDLQPISSLKYGHTISPFASIIQKCVNKKISECIIMLHMYKKWYSMRVVYFKTLVL